MTPERWRALMRELGVEGAQQDNFEALRAAHAEPHRHYHTAEHVDACLAELDTVRHLAQRPAEVELALWFHDAVYEPGAADNEERSAAWAERFLAAAGADPAVRERVRAHILATRHAQPQVAGDSALVVDIDLSILGRDAARYARFEDDVRKEYRHVPRPLYRGGRLEVLRSFLERPSIYATPHFQERYEAMARANLRQAVRKLER